jgi:hypothetical protein
VKSVAGPVKMAVSPTPDPKEREEGFGGRERPRHPTIVLPQRENVLYSWKNFLFCVLHPTINVRTSENCPFSCALDDQFT